VAVETGQAVAAERPAFREPRILHHGLVSQRQRLVLPAQGEEELTEIPERDGVTRMGGEGAGGSPDRW
jgi:hypothetical protein